MGLVSAFSVRNKPVFFIRYPLFLQPYCQKLSSPFPSGLCRNYDRGWAHAGQAVRFLNFRMRAFYGYRSSVFRETKSFDRLVSLGLIH